jgi:hypothetical protein
VVAFFYGHLRDRMERVDRLTRILTKYNPTVGPNGGYWLPYFCWPVGVVDGDRRVPLEFVRQHGLVYPVLGVVTPAYRQPFYFLDKFGNRQEKEVRWFTGRKASAFVPEAERGSFLTRLQICTRLARAVRRLHFAGLAHSDLSNKNVLIDPKGGDACVIDIDSLVVPGVAPPVVLGTPGYIAPEVVAGRASPSIETDKHALAVLIYEILLHRHPLAGRKVHSTRSAEEDEALSMGARALWIEHPTDHSNPPEVPVKVGRRPARPVPRAALPQGVRRRAARARPPPGRRRVGERALPHVGHPAPGAERARLVPHGAGAVDAEPVHRRARGRRGAGRPVPAPDAVGPRGGARVAHGLPPPRAARLAPPGRHLARRARRPHAPRLLLLPRRALVARQPRGGAVRSPRGRRPDLPRRVYDPRAQRPRGARGAAGSPVAVAGCARLAL